MAQRMLEFVMILNYKHNMEMTDFHDKFLAADSKLIFPLLFWMLERIPDLAQRAYLSRYLKNVDVPEEYFADETVVNLYQTYIGLQSNFKEIHKTVSKARTTKQDPKQVSILSLCYAGVLCVVSCFVVVRSKTFVLYVVFE